MEFKVGNIINMSVNAEESLGTINKETRKIGYFDGTKVLTFLNQNQDWWKRSRVRADKYKETQSTDSILLLYREDSAETYVPKFHYENLELWNLMENFYNHLNHILPSGYYCRAFFAKMPPLSKIPGHVDPGWPFSIQHRIHWVLSTNPQVKMKCDDKEYHFNEFEIWEFNNKSFHSVENAGDSDRVHFITDFVGISESFGKLPTPFEKGSYEERMWRVLAKKQK